MRLDRRRGYHGLPDRPPRRSEPVALQEGADAVGALVVAALADDTPAVRVRAERLVLRAEPVGEPRALGLGEHPIEARADHEDRNVGEPVPLDRRTGQHLAARVAALGALHVLDAA